LNVTSTLYLEVYSDSEYPAIYFEEPPIPLISIDAADARTWSYTLPEVDEDRLTLLSLTREDVIITVYITTVAQPFIEYVESGRII